MITNFRRWLLTVRADYPNPLDQQRARSLLIIDLLVFFAWSLWLLAVFISGVSPGGGAIATSTPAFIAVPLVVVIIYILVQSGNLEIAATLFVMFLFVSTAITGLVRLDRAQVVMLALPVVAAGLLLGRRGAVITLILATFVFLIGAFNQSQLGMELVITPAETLAFDLIVVLTAFWMIALFLYTFGGNTQLLVDQSLRDSERFQAVGRFAKKLSQADADTIYSETLATTRDGLNYSFAQIFLMDEDGGIRTRLRAGLRQSSRLVKVHVETNAASALHEAAQLRRPVMVFAGDNPLRRAHFLPSSAFGLVVPIISGGEVIALLDVQDNTRSFSGTSVTVLELLAEQAGTLLGSAQTIHNLRETLVDRETTLENLRTQLRQYQQRDHQVVSSAWDVYLRDRTLNREALGFDLERSQITRSYNLPAELQQALHRGEPHAQANPDGTHTLLLPIRLRGEMLGAMAFQMSQEPIDWQIDMARSVAERLAQALDNKRLYEQSRAVAQRERQASEVTNLLSGAPDVDTVMELAAERFQQTLGAVRTRIYLKPEDTSDE